MGLKSLWKKGRERLSQWRPARQNKESVNEANAASPMCVESPCPSPTSNHQPTQNSTGTTPLFTVSSRKPVIIKASSSMTPSKYQRHSRRHYQRSIERRGRRNPQHSRNGSVVVEFHSNPQSQWRQAPIVEFHPRDSPYFQNRVQPNVIPQSNTISSNPRQLFPPSYASSLSSQQTLSKSGSNWEGSSSFVTPTSQHSESQRTDFSIRIPARPGYYPTTGSSRPQQRVEHPPLKTIFVPASSLQEYTEA